MCQKPACHVLLIYRQMIPSVRLCGHCQMEYLAREGRVDYRAVQERQLKTQDLNWADVVLLGRLDSWYEYQLVKKISKTGRRLIYIIDDDLLNAPQEISSAAYYRQAEVRRQILGIMGMCDAILSPSPLLLEKYAAGKRRAIRVEEPAIRPVCYRPHDAHGPVKIGFAGSIDRTEDLEHMLRDALMRIRNEYGEHIQLEFFGAIPVFAQELGARCIPYRDSYDEYRQTLNDLDWDIGLAPMPDTPFHACKHYNKFIEYAAAGIMGVFSEAGPYIRLKAMDVPAAFCQNSTASWYETLRFYIEHPTEREELRKRCVEMAQDRFSVERSAAAMMDAAGDLFSFSPEKRRPVGLRMAQLSGIGHMALVKWRTHGVRLPLVAMEKLADRLHRKRAE